MPLRVVILAGGSGTRLWPLSRKHYPKQFLRLFGEHTLFQMTVLRSLELTGEKNVYIVGSELHRDIILGQLNEMDLSIPPSNVLLEPMGRNTLPAICWAVREIDDESSDILVLPSDHLVGDGSFKESVFAGLEATEDRMVVFGIEPTEPHTGYGYIKPGKRMGSWYEVERFVEKPNYERAVKYIEEGYLWNSGIFLFRAGVFLEECRRFQGEVYREIFDGNPPDSYSRVPSISMDYGIMEKTTRAAVVPFKAQWSDVGSFNALYKVLPKDENNNAVEGKSLLLNSEDNLIYSDGMVVGVDIKDMVIVDTQDAVLVAPKSSSERIREVVKLLNDMGDYRALFHKKVYRPWGFFVNLDEGDGFKVKRLTVYPGKRTSLQRHFKRSEYWTVVKGRARITLGKEVLELNPGDTLFVPLGEIHRIENPEDEDLIIVEVQMGKYLGEDDIERIEDDFGRV